jgi:O-acetyl-ADP-ribose deacetylase (regulator of RNase III)
MRGRIEIQRGDSTGLAVDAIVNAANESLLAGGGVSGAIHRAAGPGLGAEYRTIGWYATGEAKITGDDNLPAKHVIHTPGPRWRGGNQGKAALLANCYRHSLALAAAHGLRSIAFPAISTSTYGYPLKPATRIAVHEVADGLTHYPTIERVIFVCFDARTEQVYREVTTDLLTAGGSV